MSSYLTAIGVGTSAGGAYSSAQGRKVGEKYQASVDRMNAQIASWQATSLIQKGARDEQQQRLKTAQLLGAQRARLAASGVDVSQGSALNLLDDTEFFGEMDALTIRDNAKKSAWSQRVQEISYLNDAAMHNAAAASVSPVGAAFTSLLGSSNQVADSWYSSRRATGA